jgi:hypothetical protein
MEKFTGLSAAGEKDGYVVAYLDGAGPGHSWSNGHMPWGNHNEQQFADDTLKKLKKISISIRIGSLPSAIPREAAA